MEGETGALPLPSSPSSGKAEGASDFNWGAEDTLILVSLYFFGKWEGGGGRKRGKGLLRP